MATGKIPIVARVLDLVLFCMQDTLLLAGGCIAFKAECAQAKVSCLQGFVQPLGRMRAGAKLSCINVQFKTRQGNFRSARKEVVLILEVY